MPYYDRLCGAVKHLNLPMLAFDTCFERAAWYRDLADPGSGGMLRESTASSDFPYSERHLQCVWYDPLYRPEKLSTTDGEQITILHPGRWNLEAGPDFLDAFLEVGPERRRVQGDVEIHIRPEDWKHHGHSRDLRYNAVALHVTYWPGGGAFTPSAEVMHVALKGALDQVSGFHFESIDTTAYPYAIPPRGGSSLSPFLEQWDPDTVARLLDAAGEERLRQKAERMAIHVMQWGNTQSLYEGIMGALGYKHNRIPFRQLSRSVTSLELRGVDAPLDALALLLGVAGLMPSDVRDTWDAETRRFVRSLWDSWWKQQSCWESQILPENTWTLAGLRPLNHPVRRMVAAAAFFRSQIDPADAFLSLDSGDPGQWYREVDALLTIDSALPYWACRETLGGTARDKPVALIGKQRRNTILTNVIIPFIAANNRDVSSLLAHVPGEASNQWIRETASALLGPDHNPALYADGLRQQGLIQVFHDYYLPNRFDALRELVRQQSTSSLR